MLLQRGIRKVRLLNFIYLMKKESPKAVTNLQKCEWFICLFDEARKLKSSYKFTEYCSNTFTEYCEWFIRLYFIQF